MSTETLSFELLGPEKMDLKMVTLHVEICVLTDVSRDVSTGTFECSIQQVSSKTDCKNAIKNKKEKYLNGIISQNT